MKREFSIKRMLAMMVKEFIQMRRDRVTIGMLVSIPIVQLVLYGFAINVNPRHLPTVVLSADQSSFTERLVTGIENTKYFDVLPGTYTEKESDFLLKTGRASFVINIPPGFSRDFIRGDHPTVLVTADATDSSTTGNAIAALQLLPSQVFSTELNRGLEYLKPGDPPFNLDIHPLYNPESITQYNIVPGLAGVILTMTLIMITALAITKEREIGTMESLLATPIRPLEVMTGKILPYILVGYVQLVFIFGLATLMFHVPHVGNFGLLLLGTLPFIVGNLAIGLTCSTLAKNQLQAVQMSMFFFLPSILLTGFMFPFHGMPKWATTIGECLPMTHYLRIVRGVMLKGNGWAEIWPDIWPMLIFILVAGVIAIKRYRRTLD
ncbi:MAG: ABC transporter permease [Gammaproteobacteria bacterium]|nr:ABC transporter permease [Gammaproteobacteria bacterium]